ncbi:NAD(P)/FAD-dependent oxidoreductase [Methylobacterium currus]|uniref:NAD(P)/FAD-dependent oxidoreductase n=1 Tax=Methylobacterium currus TaxID=2051553 RepID=UPI001AEC8C6A|nr:FAD/NAD(P)-binding oxidoreductase [Methylobacterium currus]
MPVLAGAVAPRGASHHLVVVGGSYAGLQAVASARESGFGGRVTLITAEDHPPYQRPPLSKAYLLGKVAEDALPLRAESFYRDAAIDLVTGCRVSHLDPVRRTITCGQDRPMPFDALVIACGARARRLAVPGAELDGVVVLRDLADARALRERLTAATSVLIVGGGYIGLEVAASAASLGKPVVVLEAGPRLLARAVPPQISDHLVRLHRRRGVTIRLGTGLDRLDGEGGRVVRAMGSDGARYPCDLVVVGVGAVPNVDFAQACGLATPAGIAIDAFCRTGMEGVYAAGDCTVQPNAFADSPLRLECVQNAMDQGRSAGAAVAGRPEPCPGIPRFWSDQFDAKLQSVGLSAGSDLSVSRGSSEEGRFSLFHFRQGHLRAVDSVNRPGDQIIGRRFLAAGLSPTPDQARDPAFDLRTLLPVS